MQRNPLPPKRLPSAFAALLALGLTACGADDTGTTPGDDFDNAAPEMQAVQLSLTDDTAAEGLATDQVGATIGEVTAGLEGETAPYLGNVRRGIRELNQALRDGLEPVTAMLRDQAPTTLPGEARFWGPVTRGATDYAFVMRRGAVLRTKFSWALLGKPTGAASSDYVGVAAGDIVVGAQRRRGVGTLGVNLDNLGDVDPTVHARGKLVVHFAHAAAGTALAYRFKDFTADAEDAAQPPFSAVLDGVHLAARTAPDVPARNFARLAYYGNVPDSANADTKEFVLARARHAFGVGGRIEAIATKGDVGEGKALLVSECWNATMQQQFLIVHECNAGTPETDASCTVKRTEGDRSACPQPFAQALYPPADPASAAAPPEAPAGTDVTVPAESEFPAAPDVAVP